MMIIYKAENLITKKSYIGKTIRTLNERKLEHINRMPYRKSYFHNALKKYGLNAFKWQVIEKGRNELELNTLEQYYIQYYKTKYPNGYNLTNGGEGVIGYIMTKQHKGNLSKSKMGKKNPQFGKSPSVKTREKMSLALKGRSKNKGKIPWNKGIKMNSPTPEALERKRRATCKQFIFVSPSGIKIKWKMGLNQFCEKYNISYMSMVHYLAGRIQKTGSGWEIQYGGEN